MSIPGNNFFNEPLHIRALPGIPEVRNWIPYEIYKRPNYASENDGWRYVNNQRASGWRGRKAQAKADSIKNIIAM
jgi:hypothetical protein